MNSLVSELQQAVRYHQAGEFAVAEEHYRRLLCVDAQHPDTLHLLGVAVHQQKRHAEAVQHIRQAVALDGSHAQYHCSLGTAYRALGEYRAAESCFREALRINPGFVGAHYNLAMSFEALGRQHEAVECYREAIRLDPTFAEACNNLGRLHASLGELESAVAMFRKAIASRKDFSQAYYNLGNTLSALSDYDAAVDAYQTAANLAPGMPEIHNNLGVALKEQGRLEEATLNFRAAISLRPDYAEAQNNLGSVLQYQGDLDAAENCFRSALLLQPAFAGALTNLGNVFNDRGDLASAVRFYDDAVQFAPQSAGAHFNRALARLRAGDFTNGWPEYEWRWKKKVAPRGFMEAQWDGSLPNGRSILLYAEQGVGDEIQFASCVPDVLDLDQRGQVLLECDPRLGPLFARSFPRAQVVPRPIPRTSGSQAVEPRVDLQIALGSLPRILRPTTLSFPSRPQYLVPDQNRSELRRRYLNNFGAEVNVGITWRGGKEAELRRRRSTSLAQWRSILSISDVRFLSLQYGDCGQELAEFQLSSGLAIHNAPDLDRWNDLDGLAAEISALDLVITVDNSTAHLAGALGVPTWTLLPFVSDWRWLIGTDTSPWYPRMRLFRQSRPGDWADVLDRVAKALIEFRNRGRQHPQFASEPPPRHIS